MSQEAKTGDVTVTVPATSSTTHQQHADSMPAVSRFDQSKDPIPKVVPPRGSKDARSFRPSTLAEINIMKQYKPLTMKCGDKTIGIGCGNSLEDLLLIMGCIFALWSFVLGFVGLLLKSAIDTDRNHTALWTYFWLFLLSVILLGGMIATGQIERNRADRAAEKKQAAEDEAQAMAA